MVHAQKRGDGGGLKDWSRCRNCRYGMTGPNRMWDCNYAEMVGKCKPRPLWDEEGKCRSYQPRGDGRNAGIPLRDEGQVSASGGAGGQHGRTGGADRAQLRNGSAGHGGRVPGAEDKRPL